MSKHILLVDDDELLRRSLAYNLEQAGYIITAATSAEAAFDNMQQLKPDLILLDIGLPGMDGLEALARFKQQFAVPVIFLTARRRELDEILGLELGADDYITKPFNTDVLLAHIKAVLRRSTPDNSSQQEAEAEPIRVGDLLIDPTAHTLHVDTRPIELAPREFELLYTLAENAGQVVSTDELLKRVWGSEYEGESQVVYVHIRWLREKIEDNPSEPERLVTVRGVGYKLISVDKGKR